MAKVGAKGKYSKEKVKDICKYLAMGMTNEDASNCVDINPDTFYEWMKNKPEFSEAVLKAKSQGEAANLLIIHRAREKQWQAAAWLLERQHYDRYGIKTRLEHSGPNGAPIKMIHGPDLSSLSTEQLEHFVRKEMNDGSSPKPE